MKILPIEKIPLGKFDPKNPEIWTGFAEEREAAEAAAARESEQSDSEEDDDEE